MDVPAEEAHESIGLLGEFWVTLIALFLFTVPSWAKISTFGDSGVLRLLRYRTIQDTFVAQGGCGGFVLRSTWLLALLQLVRNLSLWLAWTFYLVRGASLAPNDTLFIVNNSLLLAGVVFYNLAEATFWQIGSFGWSLGFRIVEAIVFLAALIVVAIELACLQDGETCGEIIFLLVVLSIIFLHEALVLVPRNYYFWKYEDAAPRRFDADDIIGSVAQAGATGAPHALAKPLAQSRAAHAAFDKTH